MDFHVPAPGGVAPGNPVALAARGADPAIDVPANPAHFFRRVRGAPLQPVPGALVPVPQLLSMSLVEGVLGPAVSIDGNPAVGNHVFLLRMILPTKFETALAQLEAEPLGVGLDPTALYASLAHAASAVLAAVRRVSARAGPLHPAYVLTVADSFDLDPMAAGAPAAFASLSLAPTAFLFSGMTGPGGFLVHYGFMAFLCFGRALSNSRDIAGQPSRRLFPALQILAVAAGCATAAPAGTPIAAASLVTWLQLSEPDADVCFLSAVGGALDAREQNARDRHNLRYGTVDQKETLVASLLMVEPISLRTPTLQAVLGSGISISAAVSASSRLLRHVSNSHSASVGSVASLFALETAIAPSAHALTSAGAVVATISDRVDRIVEAMGGSIAGTAASSGALSVYAKDLATKLGLPSWIATENALIAEIGRPVPRLVVLMELMTQSPILGVRQLALSKERYADQKQLLRLSPTLVKVMDLLTDDHTDRLRHRAVADALVADPVTRLPTTNEEITFFHTFPLDLSKRILRGAFDEIDWVELLRLVLQVRHPNQEVAPYSDGLFDPMVPPLLIPLLERVSALIGLPSLMVITFWRSEEMPVEWETGLLKILPKKGDKSDPSNYRGIMLLEVAYKIIANIVHMRLQRVLESPAHVDHEPQCGFRSGRGTCDASFTIKQLIKKRREHGLETWVFFADLVKAFDRVPRAADKMPPLEFTSAAEAASDPEIGRNRSGQIGNIVPTDNFAMAYLHRSVAGLRRFRGFP